MNLYEYIFGLLTLVAGLSLTEIAVRLSRLIEYRRTVRWDIRPLLCALLGISILIINWANAWRPDNSMRPDYTIGSFAFGLAVTLLMYLTIASTLPSDPQRDTDLGDFYDAQRGTIWTLFTVTLVQWIVRFLLVPAAGGEAMPTWVLVCSAITIALCVTAIFWSNRRFTIAATIALIVIILGPSIGERF